MPTYDVRCLACDRRFERLTTIARRRDACDTCGGAVELEHRPAMTYQPFTPYFDFALGREITTHAERWRAMKELHVDYRDKMSTGDLSARADRIADQKREERHR
jgi:putative FmdB family regulatory protein